MSIWNKVAEAEAPKARAPKLGLLGGEVKDSTHKVKVSSIRSGEGGETGTIPYVMFIFEVLESTIHPPGSDAMISVFLDLQVKMQNLKGYMTAVLGHAPSPEELQAAFGEDQPHVGKVLTITTEAAVAQNGRPYARHTWRAATDAPAVAAPKAPEGWNPHPDAPGYFYKGSEVKSAAELGL